MWQPNLAESGSQTLPRVAAKPCREWQPNLAENGSQTLPRMAAKPCRGWQPNLAENGNLFYSFLQIFYIFLSYILYRIYKSIEISIHVLKSNFKMSFDSLI